MVRLRAFVTGLYYGVYITYTAFYFWQIYKAKKLMQARLRSITPSEADMGVRDHPHPGEE